MLPLEVLQALQVNPGSHAQAWPGTMLSGTALKREEIIFPVEPAYSSNTTSWDAPQKRGFTEVGTAWPPILITPDSYIWPGSCRMATQRPSLGRWDCGNWTR